MRKLDNEKGAREQFGDSKRLSIVKDNNSFDNNCPSFPLLQCQQDHRLAGSDRVQVTKYHYICIFCLRGHSNSSGTVTRKTLRYHSKKRIGLLIRPF